MGAGVPERQCRVIHLVADTVRLRSDLYRPLPQLKKPNKIEMRSYLIIAC